MEGTFLVGEGIELSNQITQSPPLPFPSPYVGLITISSISLLFDADTDYSLFQTVY